MGSKVAIFSDLHLGVRQDSATWHQIALDWADWFVEELDNIGIKEVWFLGDFFHSKFVISTITLHAASKFLEKLRDYKIRLIYGNHDLYYLNDPKVASVSVLDGYENIEIYSEPRVLEKDGHKFVFCGWGYNPLEYSGDVLLTHSEIDLFKVNTTTECKSELKPSELLKHYKRIISGHFHTQQVKTYSKGSIEYVGNTFQMNYSDACQDKYIAILDTKELTLEYIKYPNSPQFFNFNLSKIQKEELSDIPNLQGAYIKIKIDKSVKASELNDIQQRLSFFNPSEVKFDWIYKQVVTAEQKEIRSYRMEEIIKEYINNTSIDNKEEISDYLIGIYHNHQTF